MFRSVVNLGVDTKEIRMVSAMISGKKEHIALSSVMVVKFSKK